MTQTPTSDIDPQKPDRQEKRLSDGGINAPQEQHPIAERPPKSLLDWLVRVNLRLIALREEDHIDSG